MNKRLKKHSSTTIKKNSIVTIFLVATISMFLACSEALLSQEDDIMIPAALMQKANTAEDVDYLSHDEKQVIMYMNIARLDGDWFIKNILDKHNTTNSKYVKSLKKDLRKTSGLQALKPSITLSKSARFHAKDMGETGKVGHASSDGTPTFTRIRRFAKGNAMSENCSYGYSDPVQIVLQLLIDKGVPSLGHRKNMLSKLYNYVGVAIEPHKTYRYNCVQDFSDTGDEGGSDNG